MNVADFGKWVAEQRKEQGMRQVDLAALLFIEKSYISDIERARTRSPGIETLQRIAAALGFELTITVTKIKEKR